MVRSSDIVLILVAILFPPAAALIMTGCSCDLIINILLTVLGYIPGHIHAFYLIYKKVQAEERYGPGGYRYIGNAEYVPIGAEHSHRGAAPQQHFTTAGHAQDAYPAPQPKGAPPAYGATS